jgi:hypothetical protein
MNYFNKILNGNIPANIFDLIKTDKLNYKLNQEYPHLQINTNNENIAKFLYVELVKKSMKLNYNNIVSSVNTILKKSLKIAIDSNKNEITKMIKSNNDQEINIIINLVVNTFSNELLKMITRLPLTHQFKDLHIKLIELSGLTGLSLQAVNILGEKLSLEYELTKPLKMTTTINIQQVFYNILIGESKICKDISFDCLFTDEYINKLSLTIINTWEVILDNIIKTIKYDKIILFYAFSIDFVDQLHQITKQNTPSEKPRLIEGIIDAGNTTVNSESTKLADLKSIEKQIDQSKVVGGMTQLLSNAITNAVSKNSADLTRLITISNEITLGDMTADGDVNIRNISQTTTIQQETQMKSVQEITNKVVTEIASSLTDQIDSAAKQATENTKKLSDTGNSGTSVGGIIDSVANVAGKAVDGLTDIFKIQAGNSTTDKSEEDITKQLSDKFNLNQSFKYEKNSDANKAINNALTPENIAKCAATTASSNKFATKSIKAKGNINIDTINQTNVVTDVMNCAFDQKIVNDIASKIISDYNSTIKQLVDNINSDLDEESRAKVEGDIYAMGVAGSAILESVGNAGSKIIDSGGKAGTALLGGVSEVVEKGGDAAQKVGMGLAMVPLAIGFGVFLCIIAIGAMIYFASGGPSSAAAASTDVDVPKGDYEPPVETDATSMNGDIISDAPKPMASDQFSETNTYANQLLQYENEFPKRTAAQVYFDNR